MSLTKYKYDERVQKLSKQNRYDGRSSIRAYDKEFKEYQKNHDVGEIYSDIKDLKLSDLDRDMKKAQNIIK